MRNETLRRASLRLCAGVALSLGLLAFALAGAELGEAMRLVRSRGHLLVLALLPPLLTLGADAFAWRGLLGCWGHRPSLARLLPVRAAAEAVSLVVPGGAVLGEGVKSSLLERSLGVPVAHAVASIAAQRWWLMRAHAAFLVATALLARRELETLSRALVGSAALAPLLLVAALAPLSLSFALEAAFRHGRLGARSFALLARALPRRSGAALEGRRANFDAADDAVGAVAAAPAARLARAALTLLGVWLLESFDAWVTLRVVGAPLDYRKVIALEGGLSLTRALAFFAPAGLGVQDLGYLRGLDAFGVPPAAAAAFLVVKRGKEAAWVALGGLSFLALSRRGRHQHPSAPLGRFGRRAFRLPRLARSPQAGAADASS